MLDLLPVFLLLVSFIATVACVGLAVSTSQRFLWPAVFASWLGSFLVSASIGLHTLVVTFVLLALALSHSFGWLTNALRVGLAIGCGVISWWVLIRFVDDYWLFFPLSEILALLFG